MESKIDMKFLAWRILLFSWMATSDVSLREPRNPSTTFPKAALDRLVKLILVFVTSQ